MSSATYTYQIKRVQGKYHWIYFNYNCLISDSFSDLCNLTTFLDQSIPNSGPLLRSKLIHSKTTDPFGTNKLVYEEEEEEDELSIENIEPLPIPNPKKDKNHL